MYVDEKRSSMESKLMGSSDHKVLTGLLVVGGHAPGIQLFTKMFIFASSSPIHCFHASRLKHLWNKPQSPAPALLSLTPPVTLLAFPP